MTGASTTREDVEALAKRFAARWHDIAPDGESEIAATLRALLNERDGAQAAASIAIDEALAMARERDAARAEVERMREALRPFASSVFNDNGDMTIRMVTDEQHYSNAYFAIRPALAGAPRHE